MARASTDAGAAIAISRTTASHALSYYLSARHGVPHGLAAAVTLGAMLVFNSGTGPGDWNAGADPVAVSETISRVCDILSAKDAEDARALIEDKIAALGLPNRLSAFGMSGRGDLEEMAASVNRERLGNNPRRLDEGQLLSLLEELQ
jgi:alcohol dehydrogenase class IV